MNNYNDYIELTEFYTDLPLYIRKDEIRELTKINFTSTANPTFATIVNGNNNFTVKESIEEIMMELGKG